MNQGIIYKILLVGFIFLQVHFISGQIVKTPDPNLTIDNTKGILAIFPCLPGSLFLNDYYLTEVPADDTVYINDLAPGTYNLRFQTPERTFKQVITMKHGKVTPVNPCLDSVIVTTAAFSRDIAFISITGKKHFSLKKGYFYNITQFAFLNVNFNGGEDPTVKFFQNITTINGFQVTPGFCAGIGVSYSVYQAHIHNEYGYLITDDENLHFLPLFLDLRAHLPSKGRVFPFFKFDIGGNIPLKKTEIHYQNYYDDMTYVMEKGGIYISPGFGLRILINDLIQITASLEYSLEKSAFNVYYDDKPNVPPYKDEQNSNFFKICLGVGFQYR